MKDIKLAYRNLKRGGKRTIATLLITGLGAASMMIFGGYMLFTFESLAEMAARGSGHVVISHPRFFEDDEPAPLAHGLEGWEAMKGKIFIDDDVRQVLPRVNFSGLISNGEKSAIYLGTGVDTEYEFEILGPFLPVTKGAVLDEAAGGKDTPGVMLAKNLAKIMNADIGSILTLMSTTASGALNAMDVRVEGIYSTGLPEMDKRALIVSVRTAQELLVTEKVSTLSVYLFENGGTEAMAEQARQAFPQAGVKTWDELAFFYHQVKNLYEGIFGVMGVILLLLALLSVANTMSMAVMERTREIGAMGAMGASPVMIMKGFIRESAMIGAFGALVGFVIAGAVWLFLVTVEVNMPPPPGSTDGYRLYIYISGQIAGASMLLIMAVAAAGGLSAAWRGAKKPVVEALNHV